MPFVYDKSKGTRYGGTYAVGPEEDQLVFTYCKPSTDAILSVERERSRLEAKLVIFGRKLEAAVWEEGSKPLVLEIAREDLQPLAEFCADHITKVEGLVDPDGQPIEVDQLDRDDLIHICLHLDSTTELLHFAAAIKNSAGLREEVKGNSPASSESSGTGAPAPSAQE
jgi:hypothetical protein